MEKADFAAIVAYLEAAVQKPISPETARVYFDLLGDLPSDALRIAAKRALLESQYPTLPTPGRLRQLALEALDPSIPGIEAWRLVSRAVAAFGHARKREALESLPPVVSRAAESFGWRSLCDSTEPEICRAQFLKAYESYRTEDFTQRLLPDHVRAEITQLANGLALPPASTDGARRG